MQKFPLTLCVQGAQKRKWRIIFYHLCCPTVQSCGIESVIRYIGRIG